MQVIEKVKVVPEGYNGAGMNYDGGNRRDVNGKANAGLTLGILMSGGYNDDGYHFNEYEAKEVVEQMYHVKDNKKYIGEKYDMNKAHGSLFYLSKF